MRMARKAVIIIGTLILAAVVLFGRLFPGKYVTPPEWL